MPDLFVKLDHKILSSSIMDEDVATRWVWIVCLLLSDSGGRFRATTSALARYGNVSEKVAAEALVILTSPDSNSTSPENEGRRIIVEGPNQYLIPNKPRYRKKSDAEAVRVYEAERKREQRKNPPPAPPPKNTRLDLELDLELEGIPDSSGTCPGHSPPSDDGGPTFSDWWARYPKKVKRKDAERAFKKLTKSAKAGASGEGYAAWLHKWKTDGTEKRFIPNPATWLNGEQWKDEGVVPERSQERKRGDVDMHAGQQRKGRFI